MRLIMALLLVLLAATANAAIVSCDPNPPGETWKGFDLIWDAGAMERVSYPLAYDVSAFSNGRHDLQIRSVADEVVTYTGDDGSVVVEPTGNELTSDWTLWGMVVTGKGTRPKATSNLSLAETIR